MNYGLTDKNIQDMEIPNLFSYQVVDDVPALCAIEGELVSGDIGIVVYRPLCLPFWISELGVFSTDGSYENEVAGAFVGFQEEDGSIGGDWVQIALLHDDPKLFVRHLVNKGLCPHPSCNTFWDTDQIINYIKKKIGLLIKEPYIREKED
jgi:hypothetical protein